MVIVRIPTGSPQRSERPSGLLACEVVAISPAELSAISSAELAAISSAELAAIK